jgi:hypothetical protein
MTKKVKKVIAKADRDLQKIVKEANGLLHVIVKLPASRELISYLSPAKKIDEKMEKAALRHARELVKTFEDIPNKVKFCIGQRHVRMTKNGRIRAKSVPLTKFQTLQLQESTGRWLLTK